ncbi:MAG: hypothetical protein IPK80_21185 [Nannocystis sp.]|nr:hypothetical protein [Nannocystis sp.]
MKITLRPYAKDKNRWQIDIRLANPSQPQTEIRRRMVAPGGHDQKQARTWGERQVAALLRELVGEGAKVEALSAEQRRSSNEVGSKEGGGEAGLTTDDARPILQDAL